MPVETQVNSEYFLFKPFSAENLFSELSPRARQRLDRCQQVEEVKKDRVIFTSGDFPDVWTIRRGQAKLVHNYGFSDEKSFRLVRANETFGLTEAIINCPYQMSLITITACLVETIPRQSFLRLLADEQEVCFHLLELLGADMQEQYRTFSSVV